MKILAFDTSSIVASVAVMDDDKLIGEYTINHKRTHSQKLMPMIEEVLESCELTMKDIDVVAVAEGPGSFTGIRIGVATAKGLSHAMNIPVIGISTLDALAFNVAFSHGLICPILDARRNQVYTAVYKWDNGNLSMIEEHMAVSIEELVDKLMQRPEKVIFLGDGVATNKIYLIEKLKDRVLFAPNSMKMPKAASIAELALQKAKEGNLKNCYELLPTYLRKSEAERQYEEKIKRCDKDGACEG
ncbi:tRNA (adenosine(37)-N6)-threonylcarbamoyltransferase complex dimerization subunit type 1 TsaB [Crassaminicella thermophila]|uniref:tRNA (Adenosine(37)-N6)-threonylcarbamoyltransferase complex dimerization subunit type 1 TsaB n=1 Tax=Crassaminicella thermophila TaxID=2599308 RepID=A0A5C0SFH0_CRATE|nr:tRNA (adenosine(37)-N6)-threonylcarbamoyltransferase complex dimerization subunit type 1 TsaB [Crassaminicella thermophila]QEK13121.1 tRNA (adenosine(37)-N6)-threonylcarbamoyltransferase complex dimerization subunit type 1 TsaB [Crassaminicella thermophila]